MRNFISIIILSIMLTNCGFKPIYGSKRTNFEIIEFKNKNENKNSFAIEQTIMSISNQEAKRKSENIDLTIYTNKLIEKYTFSLEKFNTNVLIAYLHETYNFLNKEISKFDIKDLKENYSKILVMMLPILPHLISECLKDIQKDKNLSWPLAEKKYLEDKYVNIVIQINGKKKSIIKTEKNLDEKILLENVKKNKKISSLLEKKSIFKHIIVKNKLINLIIK